MIRNCASSGKLGQMRIQQMAFMLVAVFFFFILVGLFFVGWQYKSVYENYQNLQKQQAISSLKVISDMAELNCEDSRELCVDEDKLEIMSKKDYSEIWPVASIKVIKLNSNSSQLKLCPGAGCNYYNVYSSGQKNIQEFATYVNVCRKDKVNYYQFEKCEMGKLLAGVKINE